MSPEHKYWFPAKRYGWGWGFPSRWQGWAVLFMYVALIGFGMRFLRPDLEPVTFALFVAL
ncbi:hypothetical protein P3T22_000294 [Paraburkholderia sp. GAS348]